MKPQPTIQNIAFLNNQVAISLAIEPGQSDYLGAGVYRHFCKCNGISAKRLMDDTRNEPAIYWHIEDRIVADWFAQKMEAAYQQAVSGKTQIVIKNNHY